MKRSDQWTIAACAACAAALLLVVSLATSPSSALLSKRSTQVAHVHTRPQRWLQRANSDLLHAQQEISRAVSFSHQHHDRSIRSNGRAPRIMLAGIGSWGSGEEQENGNDWEVSMHVDKGCEDVLKMREDGNPAWKRVPTTKCDPNKRINPMMWPYDAPGKVWLHDSKDTNKDVKVWPYKEDNLHDFVHSSDPTPAWEDGVWHSEEPTQFRNAAMSKSLPY
eukprot:761396-Hanusia_phi.AAC.2